MGRIGGGSNSPGIRAALSHRLGLFAGWLPYQDNSATVSTGARNHLFGFDASDSALSILTIPAAAKAMIVNARPALRKLRGVIGVISTSVAQAPRRAE